MYSKDHHVNCEQLSHNNVYTNILTWIVIKAKLNRSPALPAESWDQNAIWQKGVEQFWQQKDQLEG